MQSVPEHVSGTAEYLTPKPVALLVKAGTDEGGMVLDPFCGCATALVAAEKLGGRWAGIDASIKAAELVKVLMRRETDLFDRFNPIVRTDIPRCTDVGKLPPYKTHTHTLSGKEEGHRAGCQHHFPFRSLTVDHILAKSKGGTDDLDNLRLLCGACNTIKGPASQAAFVSRLRREGIRQEIIPECGSGFFSHMQVVLVWGNRIQHAVYGG